MRPALYPVLFRRPLRGGPDLDLNFAAMTVLDPRVTYTGASLATLTDATGAIAYKPHNLALYSEDLSNAAYNAFATTVAIGATSPPSGFTSADKLQEGSGIQLRGQSMAVVSGQRYTQICRAKLAERSFLVARNQDSTRWCVVDLSNGTLYNAGSGFGVTITSVGGGWYEVACSFVSDTTGNVEQQWGISANGTLSSGSYDSYTGTAGYGLYITGTQWCQGAKAAYGKTTSAAYFGPRFTYDPVTHASLGLLIEEQRTNLMRYSEAFGNAAWSGANVTVTNVAGAPDGSSNLNKVQATAAAATLIRQNATVAATAATFSVYVKQGSGATDGNGFILRNATTATILLNVTVNYSTGVVTYVTGSTGVTLTDVGGGMWRLVMTATSGITSGNDIQAYAFYPGNSETAGEYVYAWGAQLEAGAFATSYIPTTSASVTRAADSAMMTGSNFSSWFNATQGTFATQWSGVSATTAPCGLMSVNDGTSSNKMDMRAAGGQTVCAAGGALQWAMSSGAGNVVAGKGAFSYATNAGNFCMNGLTVQNDASVTVPSANQIQIGALDGAATNQPNGAISRLRYYNTALTNAQLQALTT